MTAPSDKQLAFMRSLLQDVGYPAPETNPHVPALLGRICGTSTPIPWEAVDRMQARHIIDAAKKRNDELNRGIARIPAAFINPSQDIDPWTKPPTTGRNTA